MGDIACLEMLAVKPVTAIVRRHIADNSDNYVTVHSMQANFSNNIKTCGSRSTRRNDDNDNPDNENKGEAQSKAPPKK
jgi:hypothetical protein